MLNSEEDKTDAREIVLISLGGTMGDLSFLARLAQELSDGGYPVVLVFHQWYLDHSKPILDRLKIKTVGLDTSSQQPFAQIDWDGRAKIVIDLFRGIKKPRGIIGDASSMHLASPCKQNGIPFFVVSPMPFIKTKEFFLGSRFPCIGKLRWFNLLRWNLLRWKTRKRKFGMAIANSSLKEEYLRLFSNDGVTDSKGWLTNLAETIRIVSADPMIIPKPSDWSENVHVLGSLTWDTNAWQPTSELLQFLADGDEPLYVGFGSFTNLRFSGKSGGEHLKNLAEAASKRKMRIVFCTPFGIGQLANLPQNCFVTPQVSHDWLFPRCKAVICHGGYGTIYSSLKAEKPLIVYPHVSDQFYLAERMTQLGVAPRCNNTYLKFGLKDFCKQLDELAKRYDSLRSCAVNVGRLIARTNGPRNHYLKIREMVGPPHTS